ncbi:sucrose transport protein SUT1 isoform X2 [Canna indica]|uniref:Sucrose transport protein SUT3 n=1 Tax=Canna indica TaxID=4628 RepID=A0AAQ3K455_9LILI|nr:sucrose transport protein SUT1 isoform X2 [Canna indica]
MEEMTEIEQGNAFDNRRDEFEMDNARKSLVAKPISLARLIFACTVAGGVQYGWALQLSLLTPYVQTLGLSHALSSIMWLCGPVAGFIVQPIVGMWSDRCRSRFGRRRPFISAGCILICVAVTVVGFSSDIGYALGDTTEHCSIYRGKRLRAALIYVLGFWLLDFANNAVQGPTRALMADLSSQHGTSAANAIFATWMAVGNILGYSSGSSGGWHKWFPFLMTNACCEDCANLKGAFLVAVVILLLCLTVSLIVAKEIPLSDIEGEDKKKETACGVIFEFFKAFKNLPPGMKSVLLVTALSWLAWFPFNLYDTDWMGREIYHGSAKGTPAETRAYNVGVREGAFGLLLNSIVLGITSLLIEPLCRKFSPKFVWALGNFSMFACMAAVSVISVWSVKQYNPVLHQVITADGHVRIAALAVFAALGFPLAVLYSIPFAVTAQLVLNSGGGQGLCIGVLNISIVIPQVIISLGAGPFDALFGKGNMPAFAFASAIAFLCGIVAIFMLPKLSRNKFKTSGVGGGH